ncbi:MAG TPA: hypothetical protein VGF48_00880 [Thermoanaerobaculia bacterium]|jgi:hypothetical protein
MSDDESSKDSRVKEALKGWGFDVDQFEARAKQSVTTAKGDLTEITGTLRETLHRAKEVVVDLQKTGVTPVAAELKTGFERAWSEIEAAFASARQKAREGRQPAETAAEEPVAEEPVVEPAPPDDPAI